MTKIYKRRKLIGLESGKRTFAQIENSEWGVLSGILKAAAVGSVDKLYLVGALDKMTREYMQEPLSNGWKLGREFAFKHRTAIYGREWDGVWVEIMVKLISHRESWFPGCENERTAVNAWRALESEWKSTGLPLLSSPAATGRAFLLENLPRDVEFPALPDDLAKLIRANSPQHRIEQFPVEGRESVEALLPRCIQYDGRLMYMSLCGLDRLPVGTPRHAEGFTPYAPGIYDVTVRIPETWAHVGLIPMLEDRGNIHTRAWAYPSEPGRKFRTWAFEPELTLAIEGVRKLGLPAWEIFDFHDGYTFEKGRPLAGWSSKLIGMRERLQKASKAHFEKLEDVTGLCLAADNHFDYAAAAIRQILNHAIGSIHKNEFQRETFVSRDNFKMWRRENPHLAGGDDVVEVEGGYMVPTFVPDTSRLSIFMPHWSAALYSLARARVAEWALRCDPATLVKIHGDAIYSTCEQPALDELDTGRLGQPRRK